MVTTSDLILKMEAAASTAGFSTFKFGRPATINFDNNISYDLLNVDYPTSQLNTSNNKVTYSFSVIAGTQHSLDNPTGVQILDDVHLKFTDLESKLIAFFQEIDDCRDVIDPDSISFTRDKGNFNDLLITVTASFEIEVYGLCFDSQC